MIASGGISRAVPTCAQPCITNRMLVTDLNLLLLVDSIMPCVLNYEVTNCPGYDLLVQLAYLSDVVRIKIPVQG